MKKKQGSKEQTDKMVTLSCKVGTEKEKKRKL